MNRYKALTGIVFALLFAAGCSSSSGLGDIFGTNRNYDIRGTVDSVDVSNRSIDLINVSGYTSGLASGAGNAVRVIYDDRTTVQYQGRTFRPEDLERGDQVTVRVNQSGSQLLAQSMDVTYNARGGMASSSGIYGSVLHGTVRSVDNYNQTISIDRGYGSYVTVSFSSNTPVYLNNRSYLPTDLQAGDEIDVRINDLGGGRLAAQDITVTRSISSSGTYGSSTSGYSTIRGTVRLVDPSTRTIVLDSPTYVSGFRTNTGNALTIHYDPSLQIDYQGQLYPVTNLESGDVVDIQLQNQGGSYYLAQRITVVRNVNVR